MKTVNTCILILLSCFLATADISPAFSQTADDITRLGDFIDRNEDLLIQARVLVRETSSVKARTSLEAAVKLHLASRSILDELLRTGLGGGKLLRAFELARKAREVILQTIQLAKREARLAEEALTAIERATNRFDHARGLLEEHRDRGSLPAKKLLEEAHGQLQRARDNMREHLFEIALQLASSSAQLSTRAIAMIKRDLLDPDIVRHELEKTDHILERLSEQVDRVPEGPVRRMYEEARELQHKAKDRAQAGKPRLAMELTHRARDIAMRAMKGIASRADKDNVERAIQLTDALIAQAKEILSEYDAPRLRKKVDQAEVAQQQAKNEFKRGHYKRALRTTLGVRNILKEALASIRREPVPEDVRTALVTTDELLGKVAEALERSDDKEATELYVRARTNEERAWNEFKEDHLRLALAHTKLARKLARRALHRLNDERDS